MKHDEFIRQVQHRIRLSSHEDAERATQATLETLAEHLAGGEAEDLAAQLPPEIGKHLRGARAALGQRFSLEEFFRRVSVRESVDRSDAMVHAHAVIEVLGETVSKGEMDDVRAQLPAEFARLFEASGTGQMPGER
ncbi:MAG TPA: DUF2267 domain-containing protein [Ktedonobacteraceae bacterium]|nr:DUF2267 domain-containing protein [Ktedonobacteraceae bacterium]